MNKEIQEQIQMKLNIISKSFKDQQEEVEKYTNEIKEEMKKTMESFNDKLPTHSLPSTIDVNQTMNRVFNLEQIQKTKKMNDSLQKQKVKNENYSMKDIVTFTFTDCQYKIPRKYAEQLIENCEENNVIERSGQYFNYITKYFRNEDVEIDFMERQEIIEIFEYFHLNWKQWKPFDLQVSVNEMEIEKEGELEYQIVGNEIIIEKTQNENEDESIIIGKDIVNVSFQIQSIGQFMMGYCFIIGCCENKNNCISNCFCMPLEGQVIYVNHNGEEQQENGLEDPMDNDIVTIRVDKEKKIAYFSLNENDPIEIDINGESFYPFVRMKCVGSKVKIFNITSSY